jgi:VWFA-related protein
MLKGLQGRKAVLLMTDGMDNNSNQSLNTVINLAQTREVPIYTLGVGEPGKKEKVTTILVLDHSGSMNEPADDRDEKRKIDALQISASRYVDLMPPNARTTLVPFSSRIAEAEPFSGDKSALKKRISELRANGATLLYDAILYALQTLHDDPEKGKRAVIVLTDGKDEGSRYHIEHVVALAQKYEIPLHLLGLGRQGELDEVAMRFMAEKSGGSYQHAANQRRLYEVFENLSIQLHDDGIDEESLTKLADETVGQYRQARDVSMLPIIYRQIAEELQSSFSANFTSHRTSHDGTARGIDITILRNGVPISVAGQSHYMVQGILVPEWSTAVYVTFLIGILTLLALPAGIRRLHRFYGG